MKTILFICLLFNSLFVIADVDKIKVHKEKIGELEFVFYEDDRIPLYELSVYLADGALSDSSGLEGETQIMFDQMMNGTTDYSMIEIKKQLERLGAQISSSVIHEYSDLSVSGLTSTIKPTLEFFCHLVKKSTFPESELIKYRTLKLSYLNQLVTKHGSLADRVFRKLSLGESPFSTFVDGSLSSLGKISAASLKSKMDYFNEKVLKRIYFIGPKKEFLEVKSILTSKCEWGKNSENYVRQNPTGLEKTNNTDKIYLIPVPNANQAQIRVGRFVSFKEVGAKISKIHELTSVASEFMGGGFTSKLMTELRVKRGLTYSASGAIANQKYYGRTYVSTFTKNETIVETLKTIKLSLDELKKGKFSNEDLKTLIKNVSGAHAFKFEKKESFIHNILYFDHINKDYNDLIYFNEIVSQIKKEDLQKVYKDFFNWDDQIIVIVGDISLKEKLSQFGDVELVQPMSLL